MTIIKTNKLEAVYRQLETAIELYFEDKSMVSIHALASNSYDILMNINKKLGGKPMQVKEEIMKNVNPIYEKQIRKIFWGPQNFLKHADNDPDGEILFDTLLTEIYLFEASMKFEEITKQKRRITTIFTSWFLINYPQVMPFLDESYKKMKIDIEENDILNNKKEYFRIATTILSNQGMN
jgi:uncharacterized membrane protein (DUF485 family)